MIRRALARLARMDGNELVWRAGGAARTAIDRAAAAIAPPRWDRRDLAPRLALPCAERLRAGDADTAHRELSRHFAAAHPRFLIAPSLRQTVVDRVKRDFPHAARQAAARADRVLFGSYDLLGYRGLRFDGSGRFEWNCDPVHDHRAPQLFWSTVSYLDPSIGDHKIIWELNRHQHWIALGRAHWLTGESKYRDRCLAELASWLEANPPLTGINWTSMLELALRTLSWIWALEFFADPDAQDGSPWTVDLLLALDRQLAHVERNLSRYFSPNTHLTGEALALYVAGRALPELAASPRREALGRRVLVEEIDRQIAADGGHRERSTHYQRYTLDFYMLALVVARITRDPAAPVFERAVGRLAFATRTLADDRGHLPHIGDDDGGMLLPLSGRRVDDVRDSLAVAAALLDRRDLQIGSAPEEACWWLAHPALLNPQSSIRNPQSVIPPPSSSFTSVALAETGYYVSRSDEGTHLLVDGGPHGYQNGGHAHADALSLTLAVRGVPLLIDPGAGCYTIDLALRDRLRSTALHNTLTLDDRPQSIPDGPFHWRHTANAAVARWRANDGFDYFDGSHDGYGTLTHRRRVVAIHRDLVLVADLVLGAGVVRAAAHWHLDPRWRAAVHGNRAVLTASTERVGMFVAAGSFDRLSGDAESGLGWYSPAYGRVDPTTTLRVAYAAEAPVWIVTAIDLNKDNPIASVEPVPIWAEAGALAHGTAVRISRAASTDYVLIAEPAGQPAPRTWRVAEFETDARMLFCRTHHERRVTRLALVDGSLVRASGRRGLQLMLPAAAPDLHLDLSSDARIAGPAAGARLVVNGRECAVTPDRRAVPRN